MHITERRSSLNKLEPLSGQYATLMCVHECVWICALKVVTPGNALFIQKTLTRIGSICGVVPTFMLSQVAAYISLTL